ncbi:Sec63 Brl domain-containing protein, partial [Jimgerdemannia flammicorona]
MSVYALIFGAGLPYFIARWWYSSRRYTKDKILNETMANYFRELKESSTIKNLIDILSTSVEFRDEVEYRPSDAKSLQPVTASIKEELESRFSDRFEKSKKYTAPYCHKACVLIYAQLLRVDVPDGHLLRDKYVIVRKSIHLLNGMLQISLTRQWLGVSLLIMELSQQLVQAIYHKESALMQLPHLTPDILRQYYRQKRRHMRSIAQLMDLPEQDRKQLLKSLSSSQYLDVLEVAKKYPQLEVAKAKFRVAGDKIVTPGSIITFVLKLRAAQPGTAKANDVADKENVDPDNEEPVVGEAKEEEEEEEEEALDAVDTLLGGKKAEDEEPTEKSHDAHAPYFPG